MAGLQAPSTRGLVMPKLRLSTPRDRDSIELDRALQAGEIELPPFVRWSRFKETFRWAQGEHMTLVGGTGSGKTTLARQLLPLREYVVVLATKARDDSLYRPLQKMGFVMRDEFDGDWERTPKVIFRPPLDEPTKAGRERQREAFRLALIEIFQQGNWCIYGDEVRYLTQNLSLQPEFELLWLQGRSLGVSMVVSTQRPVSIPILAFEAQHMFIWRFSAKRDIDTVAEFAGDVAPMVKATVPRLPRHEALYIRPDENLLLRTKVGT